MNKTLQSATLALLLAVVVLPSPSSTGQPAADDVVVAEDQTWTAVARTIPHDLLVQAPATLRLEGVELTVGHRILVEAGARLELGPSGNAATRLTALDETIDETHGFWIEANGTIVSSGEPRTEISRMRGSGLNNLYFPGGGLRVAGRAELADIHLYNSNGTLIAAQGGSVLLERAEVANMGFMSLGALGPMEIRDSSLADSHFGIMGRTLCDFVVERTSIHAITEAVMVNSCPVQVHDSDLSAGSIGVYVAGSGVANLDDVRITGYKQDGVHGKFLPNEVNPQVMDYPRINAKGLRLEPAAVPATEETHGVYLMGTIADIRDSVITGHRQGIFGKDNSLLAASNNTFVRNRANAIFLYDSRFAGDLMDNDYGGIMARNPNGMPILAQVPVRAVVTGADGLPMPGVLLRVYAPGNSTPIAQMGGYNVTYAKTMLTTHSLSLDLTPTFLGPFTYEVSHPSLSEPVRGDLDLSNPGIVVPASTAGSGAIDWSSLPLLILFGLGILLVLLGMLPKRFLRLPFRRRPELPTTPS
ncbi:MAG: hypothetical protein QOD77_419 [Thermoplasmata archaeon]|jgi:hypothetical protein|nr:hypothetical protein [Thermoplasmata archaeon]